jgi:hypothetical protein
MKKISSLFLLIALASVAMAQVHVANIKDVLWAKGNLTDRQFLKLKESKVNFVLYPVYGMDIEEMKEELSSVWTINELVFVSLEDYQAGNYDESNAIFNFYESSVNGIDGYLMKLELINDGFWCRYGAIMLLGGKGERFSHKPTYGPFVNWTIPYLKACMALMNDKLSRRETVNINEEFIDENLRLVKEKTLLIPLEMTNELTSRGFEKSPYPYAYEILPTLEILERLKQNSTDYLLFNHTNFDNATFFISIIDPSTNQFLFYTKYNQTNKRVIFNEMGLEKMVKAIEKVFK